MGTDSVIYIRTDGNSHIATGHLVRCLCIAQALESLGKTVCFLVSDKDSFSLLHDLAESVFAGYIFSFDVKILETARYNDLELELEELDTFFRSKHTLNNQKFSDQLDYASGCKPVLLIDSYFVTENYFSTLQKLAKIAYMDDLRSFDYPVDLVINYDVIPPAKEKEYNLSYTNAGVTLLGAGYTPLRRQFQNQEVNLRNELKNVLITTGGSDPYDFVPTLADYLLSLGLNLEIHVVVGKLFKNTETLDEMAKKHTSLHLHFNVSDMASLMKQCDYAVSAAGTTLYELCALGIPSISISMADNQIPMAKTFADVDAIPYAGDIRVQLGASPKTTLNCIFNHLSCLREDFSKRRIQQTNMRHLVDGDGALKIAHALCMF